MADLIPHYLFYRICKGEMDLEDDTTKCALVESTYTPDADDDLWETGSEPFDSELANGNGYTTGGVEIAFTITDDTGNDNCKVDCADPGWTASGGAIGPVEYGVIWDDTPAGDPLIYVIDFTEEKTADDGADFDIIIDGDGLFTIAQA